MKNLIYSLLLIVSATTVVAKPYIGASIGYLIDFEEAVVSGHVGYNLAAGTGATHGIEIEVSGAGSKDDIAKFSFAPIMANYRLALPISDRFDFFGGLGLGLSKVRISGRGFASGLRDSGSAFTAQAFGGLAFNVTPKASLTVGLRHLRIGEAKLLGIKDTVGDDTSVEAGIRIRF